MKDRLRTSRRSRSTGHAGPSGVTTLWPVSVTRAVAVFAGASLLLAVTQRAFCQVNAIGDARHPAATADAGVQQAVVDANPGPWGKLKYFYIFLEAPKEMVEDYPLPSPKPHWSLPESESSKLADLFKRAGLPEPFVAALLDPQNRATEGGMLHLFPSVADVEAMTPAMREVIYRELAKYPANTYHSDPFRMTTATVDEWFRSSRLRPELVAKIRQMTYRRGDCLVFSDMSVMLNYAASDAEARMLLKAFSRTRSLMVQMELQEDTNLESLLDYWSLGIGLRRKDIEPIMQSVIEAHGVDRLGLSHVLPALARKLLYTYPGSEFSRHGVYPDCHWTSLNFFNYEPHEYLLDARMATNLVREKFAPVNPPFRYGDILFFLNSSGDAFHSCVYLADDIVFTKNGRTTFSPWVLMKIKEVQQLYLENRTNHIQGYRHKKIAGDF